MTVLSFPERHVHRTQEEAAKAAKDAVVTAEALAAARRQKLTTIYLDEGRALADLAAPIVEPFRQCEPGLEQHLEGAFLRWQVEQIKAKHRDDPEAVRLAMGVTVGAFTDRMIEIRLGFDPNDGGRAA